MRRALLVLPLLVFGCSSSGGPGAANPGTLAAQSQSLMMAVLQIGGGAQQALPAFLVPAIATAKGITVMPGAAANSYTFHIPVDTDGDGTNETSLDGTVALNGSLFTFGVGFGGTLTMNATFGTQTLMATLSFAIAADGALEISGLITLTDSTTTSQVAFEIDPATPLRIRPVTLAPAVAGEGSGSVVGNLCDFSGQGTINVSAYLDGQLYSALWTLLFDQLSISVTNATLSDGEVEMPQPDSSFVLAPCPTASIQDWAGTWDTDWFCNPQEIGQSVLVITVTGPDSIHIVDDGLEYDAMVVDGNPHVMQGVLVDDDVYEEHFLWTLSADGDTFVQQTFYFFLPPSSGGGVCGGIGVKRP